MKTLFVLACAACVALAGKTYHNPVVNKDNADPGVAYVDGKWWMVTTNNEIPAYPIRSSPDLVNWTDVGYVFTAENKPVWPTTNYWAPEIHIVNGHLNIYYTARQSNGYLGIGVATAPSMTGPWKDRGSVLATGEGQVLDATVVQDRSTKKYYLVYVLDDLKKFFANELSEDGMSLVGSRVEILAKSLDWEGILIEGPHFAYHDGYYYLFYSGNGCYDPNYRIGVARAKSPLGPYEKAPVPFFSQSADEAPGHTFTATGHGSVLNIPNTDMWYVLNHAWYCGQIKTSPYGRVAILDRMWWGEDGWPIIGQSGSTAEGEQPNPYSEEAKNAKPDIRIPIDGTKFSLETYQGYGCVTSEAHIGGNCNTCLFKAQRGLVGPGTVSIESIEKPGHFLRHQDGVLRFDKNDGSELFKKDASFMALSGLRDPKYVSFTPSNYPDTYVRHSDSVLKFNAWDKTTLMAEDATFKVHLH